MGSMEQNGRRRPRNMKPENLKMEDDVSLVSACFRIFFFIFIFCLTTDHDVCSTQGGQKNNRDNSCNEENFEK